MLEQAETEHEETTAPLDARIEAIKQASTDADRARRELWETCAYPELKDRLVQVSERLQVIHTRLASTEKEKADLRHWAESDRQEIRFVAHKSEEAELRERADRRDAKAESLEPDVAKLRKQIEQLDEEEKRIRNQMLEP